MEKYMKEAKKSAKTLDEMMKDLSLKTLMMGMGCPQLSHAYARLQRRLNDAKNNDAAIRLIERFNKYYSRFCGSVSYKLSQ